MDNITKGNFGNGSQKRKSKKKKTFFILVFIIAAAVALFFSPIFNISNITVSGTNELTSEYVISAAGLENGMHVSGLRIGKSEEQLNKTPYISSAKIRYKFPSSLEISVTEKMPVVYYGFADGYVGINVDGIVTDIVQTADKSLPVASGIKLVSYSIGQRPEPDGTGSAQIDVLTEVAGKLYDMGMAADIASVDVSEITNIILVTKSGLTVKCGDTNELEYKLSALKEVLPQAGNGGIADISTPGQVIQTIN